MVALASLQAVADVLKLFGNHGALVIKFRPTAPALLAQEPVFVLIDGIPVPLFFTSLQKRGQDRAEVVFESFSRPSLARELLGKTLYLQRTPKKDRKSGHSQAADPSLLIGFTACEGQNPLGQVEAFMDWEGNPCLSIRIEGRENALLVPFHPQFIADIDGAARCLRLTLPEGFTEVF